MFETHCSQVNVDQKPDRFAVLSCQLKEFIGPMEVLLHIMFADCTNFVADYIKAELNYVTVA